MRSTLIEFVQNYRMSKLPDRKLKKLFNEEVDAEDFDGNRKEVWDWFLAYRSQKMTPNRPL